MEDGKEPSDRRFAPFTNRLINQWTESYAEAADKIGDLEALEKVRQSFQYEPSLSEKAMMPITNPYIEEFEDLVEESTRSNK